MGLGRETVEAGSAPELLVGTRVGAEVAVLSGAVSDEPIGVSVGAGTAVGVTVKLKAPVIKA